MSALDSVAIRELLALFGETIESIAIVQAAPLPAGPAPIDAARAKLVFDAAVYATAEDLDLSPKAVRPMAALLLSKLAESGVTLAQAATLARESAAASKAKPAT